ncbi:DNA primase, large subunit [Rhodotorula sp. JG-1b]|nr:DNA primase, large subunit [Rhodotorula sp. JG-1b]
MFAARGQGSSRPSHATSGGPLASTSAAGYAAEVSLAPRSGKYPHRLNLYERPPTDEVTLEEFEIWAIDRLRLLADIEAAQARNRPFKEIKEIVEKRAAQYMPLHSDSSKSADVDKERKKDQYSHFILRLAFCRSEELRQRFLKAERELFRIRFETDDPQERRSFVESLNFGWEKVSKEEQISLTSALMAASGLKDLHNESFFKVEWTKVTDLVAQRKVLLRGGKAYVPQSQEYSLVAAEFSSRLQRGLELTAKALPRLDEDTRLIPILSHLSMGFMAGITSDYNFATSADGEAITAEMVPQLAVQSFPLCMRQLQDTLKTSKHLKHEGRQQYGLFLKASRRSGIGLSVEEALAFWRKSFSTITDDKFNKEYRYNIRHQFGLEGSRKNYTPKSCTTIITGPVPGAGQVHGCPFHHHSEAALTSLLHSTVGSLMTNADLKEILAATKAGHYHVACTRVFELQHAKLPGGGSVPKGEGLGGGDSVDHPNRYFDASRKVIKEARDKAKLEEEAAAASGGSGKAPQSPRMPLKKHESVAPVVKPDNDAMDVDGV